MEVEGHSLLSLISTVGQSLGLSQIPSTPQYPDLLSLNPAAIRLQHILELLSIWKVKSTGDIRSLKHSD